jgi:butyrate kinase
MPQCKDLVLVINPGSTTTKLALYRKLEEFETESIDHPVEDLAPFNHIADQLDFRLALVRSFLHTNGIIPGDLALVMARGGLLHPLKGGIYHVGPVMKNDLSAAVYGEHASNLGALLADSIASSFGCKSYIADPVVVDEMIEEAKVSGMPELTRKSIFHALNQKYVAREVASVLNSRYEDLRLIVAHLGGGVSVGSHCNGKVIDVNNALDGEGPFSPERSGGLPVGDLVRLAMSGTLTSEQLRKKITGNGGLLAYCGTRDTREVKRRIAEGDQKAKFYLQAMVYQISKEIASHGAVLEGKIDAIVLTGGMAYYEDMMQAIQKRIGFLAPVHIIPGEREMLSLAENAHALLTGKREAMEYV